jgi:hypothetical protein
VSAERPRGSAASDTALPGSGWTCSKKLQDKKNLGFFLARFETLTFIFEKFNHILMRLVCKKYKKIAVFLLKRKYSKPPGKKLTKYKNLREIFY